MAAALSTISPVERNSDAEHVAKILDLVRTKRAESPRALRFVRADRRWRRPHGAGTAEEHRSRPSPRDGWRAGLVTNLLAFRVSDLEFDRSIVEASDNPFLVRVSFPLNVLGMQCRRLASESAGVLKQSYADHVKIPAALASREPYVAEGTMVAHMRHVYRSIFDPMERVAGRRG